MTVSRASAGDAVADIAHIFNSAVAASAIAAAWELGAMDELHEAGVLDAEQFAVRHDLHLPSVVGIFRALASVGIVGRDGHKVTPGANFAEAHRTRSFFHWLSRGSAELLREMPAVVRNVNRTGNFFRRDAAAVAYACREINALCYEPSFQAALRGLGFDFSVVADLGCGSGERVMEIVRRHPAARGIGLDIAAGALEVARTGAGRAGIADRVRFVEADVLTMAPLAEFADVQLLTCFMMGHDFWPRERCVATLRRLRQLFPKVRRFLLGDATRTTGVADQDLAVFTLGFELAHDLMGVFIPTVADWEAVFEEGGWSVHRVHLIDMSVGEVLFELEPAGA
jgi:phenylpyruvate C(3)-methyltransferase